MDKEPIDADNTDPSGADYRGLLIFFGYRGYWPLYKC